MFGYSLFRLSLFYCPGNNRLYGYRVNYLLGCFGPR